MSVATTFRPCALTFAPHLEERVWGGRRLESYGRHLPPDVTIGESWEISAIAGRSSVVTRGPHKGEDLLELLRAHRDDIVGSCAGDVGTFPLLVKLLDSSTPLSVQLHPNDDEARALEGEGDGKLGKTEAWLILDAASGAKVIHGLAEGVDRDAFYARMEEAGGDALIDDEEASLFNWVSVRRGDVVFVPAGTIHALGAGVVLAEVQQHSDITYRIHDWGRRTPGGEPRDLHIEKARGIAAPVAVDCPLVNLLDVDPGTSLTPVLDCDKFHFDLVALGAGESLAGSTGHGGERAFHLLITWEGDVQVASSREEAFNVDPVQFVLLPAALGDYELRSRDGARALLVGAGARASV